MEKDDSIGLNHLKEMIQIFVKNTKLDLYEGFEDFWQDHEALVVIENKIYIFELKLNKTAQDALNQIHAKKYYEPYSSDFDEIYLIGVNFTTDGIFEVSHVVEKL